MSLNPLRPIPSGAVWVRRAQINENLRKILAGAGAVLAIGFAIYMSVSAGKGEGSYSDVHLQCMACSKAFTMPARAVAEVRGQAGDPGKRMTCPACGAEKGQEMMQCRCEQWYLPKQGPAPGAARCPHCGFDPSAPAS
jgi:hypothetical protein